MTPDLDHFLGFLGGFWTIFDLGDDFGRSFVRILNEFFYCPKIFIFWVNFRLFFSSKKDVFLAKSVKTQNYMLFKQKLRVFEQIFKNVCFDLLINK